MQLITQGSQQCVGDSDTLSVYKRSINPDI